LAVVGINLENFTTASINSQILTAANINSEVLMVASIELRALIEVGINSETLTNDLDFFIRCKPSDSKISCSMIVLDRLQLLDSFTTLSFEIEPNLIDFQNIICLFTLFAVLNEYIRKLNSKSSKRILQMLKGNYSVYQVNVSIYQYPEETSKLSSTSGYC
jgi:hypothetical protein